MDTSPYKDLNEFNISNRSDDLTHLNFVSFINKIRGLNSEKIMRFCERYKNKNIICSLVKNIGFVDETTERLAYEVIIDKNTREYKVILFIITSYAGTGYIIHEIYTHDEVITLDNRYRLLYDNRAYASRLIYPKPTRKIKLDVYVSFLEKKRNIIRLRSPTDWLKIKYKQIFEFPKNVILGEPKNGHFYFELALDHPTNKRLSHFRNSDFLKILNRNGDDHTNMIIMDRYYTCKIIETKLVIDEKFACYITGRSEHTKSGHINYSIELSQLYNLLGS